VSDPTVQTVRAAVMAQRQKETDETGEAITPEFPAITPHELCHTCASLAISAGANVTVLQSLLGHKTATLTLDCYGHLFPDDLARIADASTPPPKLLRTGCGLGAHSRPSAPTKTTPDLVFPVPPVGLEPTLGGF
jgi:hypothetical protein